MTKNRATSFPAFWCVHDDHWFLEASIKSFSNELPCTVFVSKKAWNGSDGPWERCVEVAEKAGAEVVIGEWPDESLHRRSALAEMKSRGHRFALIPDGDEIISPELLEAVLRIGKEDLADVVRVRMDTYWKSPEYVIRPREELAPIIALNCQESEHDYIREYTGKRLLVLSPEYGVLHHLSYAGPDERILRKIETWGHRTEVVSDWKNRIWAGWDSDRAMRNLHPTHPPFYGFTERIPVPEILQGVVFESKGHIAPERPKKWPKVSVVIPLYGGLEDIRNCLVSLENCSDLLHEVIVVDDKSPDEAASVAKDFSFAKLLKNKKNLGFGETCNRGYESSTGEVIIFLNSDTRVPRAGLIRLVESLTSSGTIGAAGPLTNNAGYYQRIQPAYTEVANLDLFADDFALRDSDDQDVSMLVGFCLAVKRSLIEELKESPFDPCFGKAMFEDTDLCYRILRAGYRLRLATRSYVHHEGSSTLRRGSEHPVSILKKNEQIYRQKWKDDIDFGFASHLSGFGQGAITFYEVRRPEKVRKEMSKLAKRANISLCMIVRNEERVLQDCLKSVNGIFSQIVIIDTGSTDSTIKIAKNFTSEVHEISWPDSFALARNESLKFAKGQWIFWMDADDTLPLLSAEIILNAVISAPNDVIGFIVPVQFVEEGSFGGTRVDHVKLFRNFPGVSFEGRIHEQIIQSLREHGGKIARLPAVVLHSGYDTSLEGQAKKHLRDNELLKLDLQDRPDHPFVLFNLGMTSHYCGDHESAVDWLTQSIAKSGCEESHVRKAFVLLGMSYKLLGDGKKALETFTQGLEVVGDDPELKFQIALILTAQNQLEDALSEYLGMPETVEDHFSSIDIGILTFKRSFNIAQLFHEIGRYSNARDWWKRSLLENPMFMPSAESYFEAAAKVGSPNDMLEASQYVLKVEGASSKWALMRAKRAQAIGLDEEGELRKLLSENPGANGPGLLLATRRLDLGDENGAKPLLRLLDEWGCAEASFYLGVVATKEENFEEALRWMLRAHSLEPDHKQTNEQIMVLKKILDSK